MACRSRSGAASDDDDDDDDSAAGEDELAELKAWSRGNALVAATSNGGVELWRPALTAEPTVASSSTKAAVGTRFTSVAVCAPKPPKPPAQPKVAKQQAKVERPSSSSNKPPPAAAHADLATADVAPAAASSDRRAPKHKKFQKVHAKKIAEKKKKEKQAFAKNTR